MRTTWKLLAGLLAIAASHPAFAWNDRGHMLACMIAYDELKPEAKAKVDAILKNHPQRDLLSIGAPESEPEQNRYIFAKASTWPDMVRRTDNALHSSEHKSQWHYINYPVVFDRTPAPQPQERWDGVNDPANIIQAEQKVRASASSEKTKPDRRAMDLSWVLHLVTDIHQPLHATSLFSTQFPQGDRGGNSFAIKRGDTPTNLHTYWDNLMGSGTTSTSLEAQVEGLKKKPELARGKLVGNTPAKPALSAWAKESQRLASSAAYLNGKLKGVAHTSGDYPKDTPKLPSDYEEAAKQVAAKQIVLAGYRLADTLNETFSPVKPNSGR